MALGFTSLDTGEETSTDGTMTSASISPTSGAVLYVTIVGTRSGGGLSVGSGSVSGLGGTWTALHTAEIYGARRIVQVWRGTKATVWGTGTLTIGAPGVGTNQDMAYVIDEATGVDSAGPDDTPVQADGTDSLTLGDVGTVDSGDAVYVAGTHEDGANNFVCTGFTGISSIGSLSNVRQIRTFYDDTTPDETPELTSDGGGNAIGGIAFVVNAAAGGNTTLTAGNGTFNLTGAAAALLHDRTLPAAAGSFNITGSAAALLRGRHLAAGSGSFALTGAAAALLWDRVMPASSGSFILTGTDVTLSKSAALSLTAESGTFNLTGAAAALLHDRILAAAAGSFSLTGTAAALLKGHHLAAGSGSFALTGAAAALLINRRLNAETGIFVLTGTPVTLTYSPVGNITLTAESGTFNLTGAAAALLHDRILAAQSASYALSGTDAVLARGSRLAAAAGGFTLTGTDVGLLLARVLNAESGAYVLTGTPVTLSYSGQLLIGIAPGIVSSSTGRNVVSSTSKRSIEST